jgi:hypothetical protein
VGRGGEMNLCCGVVPYRRFCLLMRCVDGNGSWQVDVAT